RFGYRAVSFGREPFPSVNGAGTPEDRAGTSGNGAGISVGERGTSRREPLPPENGAGIFGNRAAIFENPPAIFVDPRPAAAPDQKRPAIAVRPTTDYRADDVSPAGSSRVSAARFEDRPDISTDVTPLHP